MVKIEVDATTLRRWLRPLLAILLVIALAAIVAISLRSLAVQGDPLGDTVRRDSWQAVFLTNDRVYFGRLRAVDDDWYVLRDAYFIREKPGAAGDDAQDKGRAASQQVASVREELHGPDSDLVLNTEQVVLVENLSDDSRVVKAIDSLQEK